MQVLVFALALAVMVIGIVGTFLPAVPGLWLVWAATLGYGLYEGFRKITPAFLIVGLCLCILCQLAEFYAQAWGAKRFGAGKAGTWGAVVGSIAGMFFMPIGLLLGPFLGALVGELLAGKPTHEAVRAGWGGLLGVLGSVVISLVFALTLTVAFIGKVLF